MLFRVPKRVADRSQVGPWWHPLSTKAGRTATMKCPNGHVGSLDAHSIGEDGVVEPSVSCMDDGCSFHEMVILVDWKP